MKKEFSIAKVIKFTAIVTLDETDWEEKVCGYIALKV
jgi:hypothetical protein